MGSPWVLGKPRVLARKTSPGLHTTEYYMLFTMTWVNLEDTTLSATSQTERDKRGALPLTCGLGKKSQVAAK